MTRLAILFTNTLLLLAAVEGCARVAEWIHPPAPELTFGYAPYRMLRMVEAPWPLNRAGFRAEELETYRGSFLVEFLGGSVCLGVGTHPGKTVPERLEEDLHAAGLSRAKVLNLCQGGAPSAQETAIFLEYGLPLAPQVVLSFDGANDLMHPKPVGDDEAPNLPYYDRQMRAQFGGQHSVLEHLALFRVLGRLSRRAPPPRWDPRQAVPPAAILSSYLSSVSAVRTLTLAQGGWHALLFQPTLHDQKPWSAEEKRMWQTRRPADGAEVSRYVAGLYGTARRELVQWSHQTGAEVFDLTGAFAHASETVYSDSVHFTGERGYATLEQDLVRQGLIGKIAARYRDWERQHEDASARSAAWQQ